MADQASSGPPDTKSPTEPMPADAVAQQGMDWLATYGDQLYSYAIQRVRSSDIAEELVQETFLAALRSVGGFNRKAAEGTWLIAILRRKIADHYRAKHRSRLGAAPPGKGDSTASDQGLAVESVQWCDPSKAMSDAEFQAVLKDCIFQLPDLMRQALEFRYFDDLSPREVSDLQGISRNNLAARLYRARLLLRDCLSRRWS